MSIVTITIVVMDIEDSGRWNLGALMVVGEVMEDGLVVDRHDSGLVSAAKNCFVME